MNNELWYLILNSFAYLLLVIYSKRTKNNVSLLFSILWFFCSIFSIVFSFIRFVFPVYQQMSHAITLMPFVYLFAVFFMGILPFKFFNNQTIKTQSIAYNKTIFNFLIILLSVCSVEPLIETIVRIFSYGVGNLANVYLVDRFSQGFSTRGYFSVVGYYLFSFTDYFKYLTTPFLFVYLLNGGNNKYIIIGLSCAILNPMMNGLANGMRSLVMNIGMQFLFLFILFYESIDVKLRKMITKYGIIAVISISVLFIAISVSRFGDNDGAEGYGTFYSIIRYEGESFYTFNAEAYHIENYLGGKSVLQTFYSYFFNEPYDADTIEFYNWKTGILTNIFYTYIGVFVMDYGLEMTFVILLLLALLFLYIAKSTQKRRRLKLGTLILMTLYANIFLFGTTYWVYQNTFIHMVFAIVVAILFNVIVPKAVKRNKIRIYKRKKTEEAE